jgi:hypothetical protein
VLAELILLRALQGRHAEAGEIGQKMLKLARRARYYHHLTYRLAQVSALAGDAEQTARWLDETIAWGFPCYPVFSTDKFLDGVRESPQVRRVLDGLKVDWDRYRAALQ